MSGGRWAVYSLLDQALFCQRARSKSRARRLANAIRAGGCYAWVGRYRRARSEWCNRGTAIVVWRRTQAGWYYFDESCTHARAIAALRPYYHLTRRPPSTPHPHSS